MLTIAHTPVINPLKHILLVLAASLHDGVLSLLSPTSLSFTYSMAIINPSFTCKLHYNFIVGANTGWYICMSPPGGDSWCLDQQSP